MSEPHHQNINMPALLYFTIKGKKLPAPLRNLVLKSIESETISQLKLFIINAKAKINFSSLSFDMATAVKSLLDPDTFELNFGNQIHENVRKKLDSFSSK